MRRCTTPTVCASPSAAKLQADGTYVSIAGQIATSAVGDFDGFFYVEDPQRASGIMVAMPPDEVANLARGRVVNVLGTVTTAPSGERQISGPTAIVIATATPLSPLGMPNHFIGGAEFGLPPLGQYGVVNGFGLNNIGLLVKTWGQ